MTKIIRNASAPAEPENSSMAAAAFINAVGLFIETLVASSDRAHQDIANDMGVTPGRVSQLLAGDGNVRVATLARLTEACGADITISATDRQTREKITAPRSHRARPVRDRTRREVQPLSLSDKSSLKAAGAINAVASLLEQLAERPGQQKQSIADGMGVSPARVSQLLNGDGNIRMATLGRWAEACGVEVSFRAVNQQSGEELAVLPSRRPSRKRRRARTPDIETFKTGTAREIRARMNELAPVNELRQRKILPGTTLEADAKALCDLYEIADLWQAPKFVLAARRNNVHEPITPTQKTWLACAKRAAKARRASAFARSALEDLAKRLAQLANSPEKFLRLPEAFSETGVRLVYVQPFKGNKLSGAAFYLDENPSKPVIAVSGLGKRLDKVLFTLLHEIAHIVLGHASPTSPIWDKGEDGVGPQETAANSLAGSWLFSNPLQPPTTVSGTWIEQEATARGIDPSVIVGHLQFKGRLAYQTHLARNLATVTDQLSQWSDQ